MFVGLNEVCDSFFVPALEVLVDAINMDMTVAGATFMAAGGSAPELFTSFLGVFVSKNNVGFGTIVGSAVFNVLFVIGVCAIAASKLRPDGTREALELTPYPLFRDCLWYILSLGLLVAIFIDGKIEWWEALIQFMVYIGYVTFMMRNKFFEKQALRFCPCLRPRHPTPRTKFLRKALHAMMAPPSSGSDAPAPATSSPGGAASAAVGFATPQIKVTGDGETSTALTSASAVVVAPAPGKARAKEAKAATQDDGGAPKRRQSFVEVIAEGESRRGGDAPADDGSGVSKAKSSWKTFKKAVASIEAMAAMVSNQTETEEPEGMPDDYLAWPSVDDKDDDDEPITTNICMRITMFLIVAPIRILLTLTIPDPVPKAKPFLCLSRGPCDAVCVDDNDDDDTKTGREGGPGHEAKHRRTSPIFVITFVMSIIWIGVFSYFMVWWATLAGVVFRMPPEVMGLTFLAAGTSVPDLLTSVIVASKGYGDMAVSSSIGSNVFDVTVGLPIPWLLGCIAFGQPIQVGSDGLTSSVIVLFLMLMLVVVAIAASGWKMSITLGVSMFVLYGLFVAHSLLTEYGIIPPIV